MRTARTGHAHTHVHAAHTKSAGIQVCRNPGSHSAAPSL